MGFLEGVARVTSRKPWPGGGYIRIDERGLETYIIEREVGGQRFHVSTRCHSRRAAEKQLERFEADPENYQPAGAADEPLLLTNALIEEFEAFSIDVRGNTGKYAAATTNRLGEWMVDLGRVDLRKVTLRDHVVPALEKRKTGRASRIIALKAFMAWLRKEKHLLASAQDCTVDLPVPQGAPEKHVRRKAVARERVAKAYEQLAPAYRDVLQLLATTGWHVTELERFVRGDRSDIVTPPPGSVDSRGRTILAVLVTPHKSGDFTRTSIVGPKVLEAAKRLKERGEVPRRLNEAVDAACQAAGVPSFTLGVMRHSVATWAVEHGDSPKAVAEALNHHDDSTTRRFYIDVAVPAGTLALAEL